MIFVVAFLNWPLDQRFGTWERSRAFRTEGEARRFVATITPFSDRYAVQAEVLP